MTTEMIIEKIEKIRDKTYLTHSEHEALDMAINALEKAEKYRWHNLRKNPDDLPREDGMYLVKIRCGYLGAQIYATREFYSKINRFSTLDIIAWQEIELLEEGDME